MSEKLKFNVLPLVKTLNSTKSGIASFLTNLTYVLKHYPEALCIVDICFYFISASHLEQLFG